MMKVYKYELKCYNSVKKVTEYLAECNLKELGFYLDENIVFSFNDDGEIEQIEDDDHFLNVVKTNSIKSELVEIPKETLNNIWYIYIQNHDYKKSLEYNNKQLKEIISGLENAK